MTQEGFELEVRQAFLNTQVATNLLVAGNIRFIDAAKIIVKLWGVEEPNEAAAAATRLKPRLCTYVKRLLKGEYMGNPFFEWKLFPSVLMAQCQKYVSGSKNGRYYCISP